MGGREIQSYIQLQTMICILKREREYTLYRLTKMGDYDVGIVCIRVRKKHTHFKARCYCVQHTHFCSHAHFLETKIMRTAPKFRMEKSLNVV